MWLNSVATSLLGALWLLLWQLSRRQQTAKAHDVDPEVSVGSPDCGRSRAQD
jgi:hypothetical protein